MKHRVSASISPPTIQHVLSGYALRKGVALLALSVLVTACGGDSSGSRGTSSQKPGGEQAGPDGAGTALVTWDAPAANVDGSCISDLKSFRISYGLAPRVYDSHQTVDSSACVETGDTNTCGAVRNCSYLVENLGNASWHFAVQAIDSAGNLSEFSDEAFKTVE